MSVIIAAACRTPVGSAGKSLASFPAPMLAAIAIRDAVFKNTGLQDTSFVEEVYLGNVLSAGVGQAPARQASLLAGLAPATEATTINKVCASGLKAVTMACQSISCGHRKAIIAGGMESMSNAPFLVQRRLGFGNKELLDGLLHDGLWDPYNKISMGSIAERCAKKLDISRSEMDEYSALSYQRLSQAWKSHGFLKEIVPLPKLPPKDLKNLQKNGLSIDEELAIPRKVDFSELLPAFDREKGRITAGNSSKLSDGASVLLLIDREHAEKNNIKGLAQVVSFADAASDPMDFPIAPSLAIPIALARANLDIEQIAKWEINEAFAAVAIANMRLLSLKRENVNVNGGAVAMGHPIGSSGSRILVTLLHTLEKGEYGCAAICNGGGGATAVIIKRI